MSAGMSTATVIMNVCDDVSEPGGRGGPIVEQAWTGALGAVTEEIEDCFERREPRALVREMTEAMLMERDKRDCWTSLKPLPPRATPAAAPALPCRRRP